MTKEGGGILNNIEDVGGGGDESSFMDKANVQHHQLHRESSLIISKLSASEKVMEKLAEYDSRVKRFERDHNNNDTNGISENINVCINNNSSIGDEVVHCSKDGIPEGAMPPSVNDVIKHLNLPGGNIIDIIGLDTILLTRGIRIREDLGYKAAAAADIKHLYEELLKEIDDNDNNELLDLNRLFKVDNNNSNKCDSVSNNISYINDDNLIKQEEEEEECHPTNDILQGLSGGGGVGKVNDEGVNARERKKAKLNALNAIRLSYLHDNNNKMVYNDNIKEAIVKLLRVDSDRAVTLTALATLKAFNDDHWVIEGIAAYLSKPVLSVKDARCDELKDIISKLMIKKATAVIKGCYKSIDNRIKMKNKKTIKWIPYEVITRNINYPTSLSSEFIDICVSLLKVDESFEEGTITSLHELAQYELQRLAQSDIIHGA